MQIIEVNVVTPDAHVAIAVARFNQFINSKLLAGAIDILKRIGQIKDENITIVWVPGSYELPLVVSVLVKSGKYDAVIALGTIIRGDTEHYKLITSECISGLSTIAINSKLPVIFGILVTDNVHQAIERVGVKINNKGSTAAMTALEMINILKKLGIS